MTTATGHHRTITGPHWRGLLAALQDTLLVLVVTWFLFVHLTLVLQGHLSSVFFATEQGVTVLLFVMRRRSTATSSRTWEWAAAGVGTWLPLVLQSNEGPLGPMNTAGVLLQFVGLTGATMGFLFLGRSFGIVAADRGLKSAGPYSHVRHPIYLSHLVTLSGFLLANPSAINLALEVVIVTAVLLRIAAEERVLRSTGSYHAYATNVRWRLIPGLY